MSCLLSPLRSRILLTLLSALMLVSANQVQAAMPVHGALTAVEICGEGVARTIYIDAAGNEQPAPHDCSDCPECALPMVMDFQKGASLSRPSAPSRLHPVLPTRQIGTVRARDTAQPRAPPDHTFLHDTHARFLRIAGYGAISAIERVAVPLGVGCWKIARINPA